MKLDSFTALSHDDRHTVHGAINPVSHGVDQHIHFKIAYGTINNYTYNNASRPWCKTFVKTKESQKTHRRKEK